MEPRLPLAAVTPALVCLDPADLLAGVPDRSISGQKLVIPPSQGPSLAPQLLTDSLALGGGGRLYWRSRLTWVLIYLAVPFEFVLGFEMLLGTKARLVSRRMLLCAKSHWLSAAPDFKKIV